MEKYPLVLLQFNTRLNSASWMYKSSFLGISFFAMMSSLVQVLALLIISFRKEWSKAYGKITFD